MLYASSGWGTVRLVPLSTSLSASLPFAACMSWSSLPSYSLLPVPLRPLSAAVSHRRAYCEVVPLLLYAASFLGLPRPFVCTNCIPLTTTVRTWPCWSCPTSLSWWRVSPIFFSARGLITVSWGDSGTLNWARAYSRGRWNRAPRFLLSHICRNLALQCSMELQNLGRSRTASDAWFPQSIPSVTGPRHHDLYLLGLLWPAFVAGYLRST